MPLFNHHILINKEQMNIIRLLACAAVVILGSGTAEAAEVFTDRAAFEQQLTSASTTTFDSPEYNGLVDRQFPNPNGGYISIQAGDVTFTGTSLLIKTPNGDVTGSGGSIGGYSPSLSTFSSNWLVDWGVVPYSYSYRDAVSIATSSSRPIYAFGADFKYIPFYPPSSGAPAYSILYLWGSDGLTFESVAPAYTVGVSAYSGFFGVISASPLGTVSVASSQGGIAIDNVTLSHVPAQPVPETSSALLLSVGLISMLLLNSCGKRWVLNA